MNELINIRQLSYYQFKDITEYHNFINRWDSGILFITYTVEDNLIKTDIRLNNHEDIHLIEDFYNPSFFGEYLNFWVV